MIVYLPLDLWDVVLLSSRYEFMSVIDLDYMSVVVTDLDYMSVGDVATFLEVNGFSKYIDTFRDEGIDGGMLQLLEKAELKQLRVEPLDRVRILKAVKLERGK